MVGTTVGHYRVVEKIGSGGMGVVYRAEDLRLGRFVALKVLPDDVASDAGTLKRFLREARAVSALNHPNICTLYDIGEQDGSTYLVMELLEGLTLREMVLERGAVPLETLLAIAIDVAEGLAAAHAQDIIHRDIKPANIFVTKSGRAKVLDFGLAKVGVRADAAGTPHAAGYDPSGSWALGTIANMSPEQALGKPLDERSDVFSFGTVLYEMATGHVPFDGDTTGTLFLAVVQGVPVAPIELNPEVPKDLQRIIQACLQKDPTQRYQRMADVLADLRQLQRELVLLAAPTERRRPLPVARPGRRRGLVWALWATAALLAISLSVVATRVPRRPAAVARGSVVLADFVNTTGEAIFDGSLRRAAALDLEQSPFLTVLSGSRVAETLGKMDRAPDQRLTRDVAQEICVRTNSGILIVGSIAIAVDGYSLTMKAWGCAAGNLLADETEAATRDGVLAALNKANGRLRRRLGESLSSLQRFNTPLAEATTSSLEALQLYSTGLKERQSKGSLAGIPYLQRAVEIDPTFALAHGDLGSWYRNTSQWARARDALSRAYELRGRLGDRERFRVELGYFDFVTGESDKTQQVCREWIRSYPGDSYPQSRLGLTELYAGRFEEAAREFREALRLGTDTPYSNLMTAYLALGRFDEAAATYEAARADDRDSEFLRQARYTLAFLQHDARTMQEQAAWAKGKPGYEDTLLRASADVEAYHGRFRNARQLRQQAWVSAAATGTERPAGYDAADAWQEAEVGNVRLARDLAMRGLGASDAPGVRATVALALARLGDLVTADRIVDELNKANPVHTRLQQYTLPTVRAVVAIGRQQPARAIELLRPVASWEFGEEGFGHLQPVYVRGVAYLQLGDGRQAAIEFRKLMSHPGFVGLSVTGALAHLYLGRAEEASGHRDEARKHYQDFLALWKDADPDVPLLRQALAEYARLK